MIRFRCDIRTEAGGGQSAADALRARASVNAQGAANEPVPQVPPGMAVHPSGRLIPERRRRARS